MADRAISWPFKFTDVGSLGTTADPEKIWKDRITLLCLPLAPMFLLQLLKINLMP